MARKVLKEVMFEEEGDEEFEICIKCGKLTTVKKGEGVELTTDNVVYRSGYIEGAGQLCLSCGQNTIKEWTKHG